MANEIFTVSNGGTLETPVENMVTDETPTQQVQSTSAKADRSAISDNTRGKQNQKKQGHKRISTGVAGGPQSKRPPANSFLNTSTNNEASQNYDIAAIAQAVTKHTTEIENLSRQVNALSIRVDGVPSNAEDPQKVLMDIVRTCLMLGDLKPEDFSVIKFIKPPKNNTSKTIFATFIHGMTKKKFNNACKLLKDNKLYGEHAIRIQQMYTSKQVDEKNTALVIKKACEEYGRMVPSFLNGETHLKLVGYNLLDFTGKNTAVHCSKWLEKLNKENKKSPCNDDKFKAELEKANNMAAKFLTK